MSESERCSAEEMAADPAAGTAADGPRSADGTASPRVPESGEDRGPRTITEKVLGPDSANGGVASETPGVQSPGDVEPMRGKIILTVETIEDGRGDGSTAAASGPADGNRLPAGKDHVTAPASTSSSLSATEEVEEVVVVVPTTARSRGQKRKMKMKMKMRGGGGPKRRRFGTKNKSTEIMVNASIGHRVPLRDGRRVRFAVANADGALRTASRRPDRVGGYDVDRLPFGHLDRGGRSRSISRSRCLSRSHQSDHDRSRSRGRSRSRSRSPHQSRRDRSHQCHGRDGSRSVGPRRNSSGSRRRRRR